VGKVLKCKEKKSSRVQGCNLTGNVVNSSGGGIRGEGQQVSGRARVLPKLRRPLPTGGKGSRHLKGFPKARGVGETKKGFALERSGIWKVVAFQMPHQVGNR